MEGFQPGGMAQGKGKGPGGEAGCGDVGAGVELAAAGVAGDDAAALCPSLLDSNAPFFSPWKLICDANALAS